MSVKIPQSSCILAKFEVWENSASEFQLLSSFLISRKCPCNQSVLNKILRRVRLSVRPSVRPSVNQSVKMNKSLTVCFIVCCRIDTKGDVLAIESKQVIEMKEGNTIAPYTFRRVSGPLMLRPPSFQ